MSQQGRLQHIVHEGKFSQPLAQHIC